MSLHQKKSNNHSGAGKQILSVAHTGAMCTYYCIGLASTAKMASSREEQHQQILVNKGPLKTFQSDPE